MKDIRIKTLLSYLAVCLVFAAFALTAHPVSAQDVALPEEENALTQDELLTYMAGNPEYEKMIQDLMIRNVLTISYECTEPTGAKRLPPVIYEPVLAKQDKSSNKKEASKDDKKKSPPPHPVYGQWKDSFRVKACDNDYQFNFLAVAAPEGPPSVFPLTNGTTKLDPIYQRQAEEKATLAIKKQHPALCERGGLVLVSKTKFLGYIQEDKSLGSQDADKGWFEEWVIWQCRDVKKARIAILQKKNLSFEIYAQYIN